MSRTGAIVFGTCDARFAAAGEAFEGMLVSGAETGASVAAYVDGRLVMDLWGGSALKGVPWH